jgi:aspartate aminotransferase
MEVSRCIQSFTSFLLPLSIHSNGSILHLANNHIMKFALLAVCVLSIHVACALSLKTPAATAATAASLWKDLEAGPPDAILGIAQAFRVSTDPRKVNVCVGAYRDAEGNPWVLPSVRAAEQVLMADNDNKEYLPIEGDADFVNKALAFAYGDEMDVHRIAGVQTLSGTGACRIGGQFLSTFLPGRTIYIPTPTW